MRFAGFRKARMVRGESLNLFRAVMRFTFFGALRRLRREWRSRTEELVPNNSKASALRAGYFLWRKESNQRKHSGPIRNSQLNCGRDFSMRHPCLIEKRRTSCAPPYGSPDESDIAIVLVPRGR
jgi:hypothetical protein